MQRIGANSPRLNRFLELTAVAAPTKSRLISRLSSHRLSLKKRLERGELAPIVDPLLRTSILAGAIQPGSSTTAGTSRNRCRARDRLIVENYCSHFDGRKAVAFCRECQARRVAGRAIPKGRSACEISFRTPCPNRARKILAQFHQGDLRFCARATFLTRVGLPDVEVLLMTRPTLSKVVYMQQLGRGTRKRGKRMLVCHRFRG